MRNSAVSIPQHVVGGVSKKDANYVFYELIRSICPSCRKMIDAKILLRDNKIFMAKRCPGCGPFEALVYGDAEAVFARQLRRRCRTGVPATVTRMIAALGRMPRRIIRTCGRRWS